ncbi:MAG: DNA cytosine methyltransferase [archaeon GB-1867-005]|nr:DNA cytosine methyltransferase [Candidatus Culexmicrobium cathedralense]
MASWTVVDLFAGAGGFSRGFKEAGFQIVAAIENFKPVAITYSENFSEAELIVEDIKRIHSKDLLSLIGSPPDVVIGGPPCEPFTAVNIRRRKDPLDRLYGDPIGRLVLHFIRFVGDLKPKVFVMENVPQILDGELKYALRKEFARVGYPKIYFNILRAEDYGTPSRRVRVFISNIKLRPVKVKVRIPVMKAIGDLPDPYGVHDIPNHDPVPLSPAKLKKVSRLKWGDALVHFSGASGRFYTNWVRLRPYRLAPTVLGRSRFIHPFENRLLTVREQARLMGFPDDHVFHGGREVQFDQVGEAVPVPLAKAIALSVKKYLESCG